MVRENILKKQKIVDELAEMISRGKTVAIASIDCVPASSMQKIRRELADKVKIKVVKNSLILRALEKAGAEKVELGEHISGPTAVIVTDMDPFRLYRRLKELREYAPAKAGQVALTEIVVEKGVTPVPAPMIAEIKAAGIPSKVTRGFVEITEDYVAVKEGETISQGIANALSKLGVKPVEIMVRINAAWNEGMIFVRAVLDVSVEKVLEDVRKASAQAMNLAVNVAYPTKESVGMILAKAGANAKNLSINAGYVTGETLAPILAKARAQAIAVASKLPPDALDESTRALMESAEKEDEETPTSSADEEKEEEEDAASGLASLFG